MKLKQLTLTNFKGIKSFTLDSNGQNIDVLGDNGTGKTTLADAITWLLFDKDSQGNKKFEIKTVDKDGKAISGLVHEVEGIFIDDIGREIQLNKAYSEKWTKKRGSASKEFSGHTTEYHVEGVPVQLKGYKEEVAKIADEDTFRMLTTPSYFPEMLHWQKRRELLLEVCGDVSDNDVIASNKKLADLPGILNGRPLEDHKKVVVESRTKINKELQSIPTRIDENERDRPDMGSLDTKEDSKALVGLNTAIDKKKAEIAGLKAGSQGAEIKRELAEAETNLRNALSNDNVKETSRVLALKRPLSGLENDKRIIEEKLKNIPEAAKERQGMIDGALVSLEKLREEGRTIFVEKFSGPTEKCCGTCGQDLPEEIQASAFNTDKALRLEAVNVEGTQLKNKVTRWEVELAAMVEEEAKLKEDVESINSQIADIEKEILDVPEHSLEYFKLEAVVAGVKEKLAAVDCGDIGHILSGLEEDLRILEGDKVVVAARLAKVADLEKVEARTKELKAEEKRLAAEYERLESELFLIEEFTRTKVSMLEQKINGHFKMARFKLFEEQINGGLAECCEVVYNGVPFSAGLNSAARVNVGLDVIRTLSVHYGVTLPVIIDNAESVNELEEIESQVIRLIVSKDKTLVVKN